MSLQFADLGAYHHLAVIVIMICVIYLTAVSLGYVKKEGFDPSHRFTVTSDVSRPASGSAYESFSSSANEAPVFHSITANGMDQVSAIIESNSESTSNMAIAKAESMGGRPAAGMTNEKLAASLYGR